MRHRALSAALILSLLLPASTAAPFVAVLALSCAQPGRVSPSHTETPERVWSPPLVYPPELREARVEGSVTLEAVVDSAGTVDPGSIRVLNSSHEAFEAPAITMLRGTRFRPGHVDGRTVTMLVQVPVHFTLQGGQVVEVSDSIEALSETRTGERLARAGRIGDAMAAFSRAQVLDPRLHTSSSFWFPICWYGSLWGHAADVIDACDEVVRLAPTDPASLRARGVARIMTGNFEGAIADLEMLATLTESSEERTMCRAWVDSLRSGQDPLTPQVVESMRRREE